MKKYNFEYVVIEVTRRCNMSCAHCLRGEAEKIDIKPEYIDKFMENVETIGSIAFTGGEPTLNLDAIEHTLDVVKNNNIWVGGFYIVTNGKEVSDRFLRILMNWTLYCLKCNPDTIEEGISGVTISHDIFHDKIAPDNEVKLKILSIYRANDKTVDWNKEALINKGRARDIPYKKKDRDTNDMVTVDGNYVEDIIALTSDGSILADCDYEYSEIAEKRIGHVEHMDELYEKFKKAADDAA